ncbi:hypothetical protein HN51_066733 [Arachis hypogaea]|nr:uncharacterized protein DS421_14g468960 [Arachis hypogaea]
MEEGRINIPSIPSRREASPYQDDYSTREVPCSFQHHSSVEGNINNNNNNNSNIDVSMFSYARCYCYYLMEAMPQPGPTWSTTDPCVMAEPPSSSLSSSSVITIEDYNKNNSSYSSWWMGFLDDLDGKNMNIIDNNEETSLDCYPFVDNNSKDGICYESQSLVDAIDLSCCYADDWLMVPTMEKDWGEIV